MCLHAVHLCHGSLVTPFRSTEVWFPYVESSSFTLHLCVKKSGRHLAGNMSAGEICGGWCGSVPAFKKKTRTGPMCENSQTV